MLFRFLVRPGRAKGKREKMRRGGAEKGASALQCSVENLLLPWRRLFLLDGPGAGAAIPYRKRKPGAASKAVSHFPKLVSRVTPARVCTHESRAGLIVRASLGKPHPRWRPTFEDSQNAEQDLTVRGESAHSSANESGRR